MIEFSNLSCAQDALVAVDAIVQSQVHGGESSSTNSFSSVVSTTRISNTDNPDGTFNIIRKVAKSGTTIIIPTQIDDSVTNILQQFSLR
jgi:N-acetylglucosamine-6-phosphate deacetylase